MHDLLVATMREARPNITNAEVPWFLAEVLKLYKDGTKNPEKKVLISKGSGVKKIKPPKKTALTKHKVAAIARNTTTKKSISTKPGA